jgi:hypothetical protein
MAEDLRATTALEHDEISPVVVLRARGRARWSWLVVHGLGALAVLLIGAVHLQQYRGPYAAVPTIGTLFLVNVIAATVIGVALLSPIEHLAGRWAGLALGLALVGGIGLAAVSFVMLLISEHTPLFGFREPGYDPTAIATSRATEVAAMVLLSAALALRFTGTSPKRRW